MKKYKAEQWMSETHLPFLFFIQNTLKCEFTVAASPFCTEQFHKCKNGSCRNRYVCSLMDTAIHKGKLL